MAEPMKIGKSLLPIDRESPINRCSYRELIEEMDEEGDLQGNEFAVNFIADAIDNPERFRSHLQLQTIVNLYEKYML